MGKRVLTSNGKVIDLDRGGVETLPADSLVMEKHSYGYYDPPSFSLIFNGRMTAIRKGLGQFYDEDRGERRLISEAAEMKKFPAVYPVSIDQDSYSGNVYYTIYLTINGIQHKVVMTYDSDHPDYQMEVVIEHPRLDTSRMVGHWYRNDKPCYIENWNRSWTALKTATQIRFWLNDYYKDRTRSYEKETSDYLETIQRRSDDFLNEFNRSLERYNIFGGPPRF